MAELTNSMFQGYHADIVMCVNKTGGKYSSIDQLKGIVKTFYDQFKETINNYQMILTRFRVKIIAFGDYGCDLEPMVESDFFEMDEQMNECFDFINNLETEGGENVANNAYEAITLALKSDWVRTGDVRRHITMVLTDAPALSFSARREAPLYPSNMPEDLEDLQEIWEGQEMETRAKRLILLAPDDFTWAEMSMWNNTFHFPIAAGE